MIDITLGTITGISLAINIMLTSFCFNFWLIRKIIELWKND